MENLFTERYIEIFTKRFTELLSTYKGSYKDLALELGLKSKSSISKYANGNFQDMSISMIEKIATFFKVSPAWLVGWSNDKNY